MNNVDELARRYFALWTEYLTALVAEPQAAELMRRWVAFTGQFATVPGSTGDGSGAPLPGWPPIPSGLRPGGSPPTAAPAAGASGERGLAVDELARRLGELERRLAALEQRPKARRPRRGNRASGE
jgi:hypothetical protein